MINHKLKITLLLFVLWPLPSLAATLYFSPEQVTASPGEPFAVTVMLDNQGQSINAVSGELHFPSDELTLKEIRDGDSIINFWLEHPVTSSSGVVSFAGVIPGGFSGVLSPFHAGGAPGKLFTLIFSPTKEGTATVSWSQISAFLNSPDGQSADVITKPLAISSKVGVANSAPVDALASDTDPPELFQPTISHDPNLFAGQWFVVFTTRDTGSGLDHYEIAEHRQLEPALGDWQEAASPFLLRDQNLGSYVSVRALDRAGNERVVTLPPALPASPYAKYYLWVIIIVLCGAAFFYYFYYYRRRL